MSKKLQRLFHFLFGWLQSAPIQWERGGGPRKHPAIAVAPWEIVDGKLLFSGEDYTPSDPMSLAELEFALRRMKGQIADREITVDAILIEKHIATGLWDQGLITRAQLESADGRFGGITIKMELLGEMIPVSIQDGTYSPDYEFVVTGIPGMYRVRDIPDALALVAGEKITL